MGHNYYFCVQYDPQVEMVCACITNKDFFDKNNYLLYEEVSSKVKVPEGMFEEGEGYFSSPYSEAETRKKLIKLGFIEKLSLM